MSILDQFKDLTVGEVAVALIAIITFITAILTAKEKAGFGRTRKRIDEFEQQLKELERAILKLETSTKEVDLRLSRVDTLTLRALDALLQGDEEAKKRVRSSLVEELSKILHRSE